MSATGNVRRRGFTLLELIIVLALIAMLATALPIAFRTLIPGQQLRVAAADLASELRALQSRSELTGEVQQYRAADVQAVAGIQIHFSSTTPVSEPLDSVQFFPDGSSSGGRITLALGERRRALEVSALTGRVRQVSP